MSKIQSTDQPLCAVFARVAGPTGPIGPTGLQGLQGIVPTVGALLPGRYYCIVGVPLANSFGTRSGAADQLTAAPVVLTRTITPSAIGASVATPVASALFRIILYNSDADDWPLNIIWDSGILTGSASGFQSATGNIPTLTGGVVYWSAVHHSSNCTLRSISVGSAISIGGVGPTAFSSFVGSAVRQNGISFAGGAPDPWGFDPTHIVGNTAPDAILALL